MAHPRRTARPAVLTGIAAGVTAGALWGLVFIAPRMLAGYSPVDITAGRFVAYGLISVAALMLARTRRRPAWREVLAAAVMSILGYTGYYLLLVFGIRDAGTAVPALVIGTIPIWMMLLGKPKELRLADLLPGLALTAAGIGLMATSNGAGLAASGAHFARGIAYTTLSLCAWTGFALLNARWLKRHPDLSSTEWANWLGVATGLGALLLWAAAGSSFDALAARDGRWSFVVLSVLIGFGSAWLASILWNIAGRRLPASLAGQLIVSETLFALAYTFAWDARWPTAAEAGACVLFTLGIVGSIRAHRR